jgi:hypothetical protein
MGDIESGLRVSLEIAAAAGLDADAYRRTRPASNWSAPARSFSPRSRREAEGRRREMA